MDLTTLGIGVDSRPIDDANKKLDDLTAKAGKAEGAVKGLGDSAREGGRGFNDLEGAMTRASIKGNVIGDAIAKGVQIAIDAVKQLYALMQQVGDYQDMADMTGATAVNLAKMQTAADVAGVSMNTLSGYMNQMTRIMSNVDEGSDKAASAVEKLGLNFADLIAMDPADRMREIAVAMREYGDGVERTEILQALFGRGAGEVGKVIKELGEETAYTTHLTADMIAKMDDLNDSNARLESQMRQFIQFLVTGASTAMSAFMVAIDDLLKSLFDVNDQATALGMNKGIEAFAIHTGRLFAQVIEAGQIVYRAFESIASAIQMLQQSAAALEKFDFGGVAKAWGDHSARMKDILNRELFSTTYENALAKVQEAQKQRLAELEQQEAERLRRSEERQREWQERQHAARERALEQEIEDARKAQEAQERTAKQARDARVRAEAAANAAIARARAQALADEKKRMSEIESRRREEQSREDERFRKWQAEEAEYKKANDERIAEMQKLTQAAKDQQAAVEAADRSKSDSLRSEVESLERTVQNYGKLRSEIEQATLEQMELNLEIAKMANENTPEMESRIELQRRKIAAIRAQETLDEQAKLQKATIDTWGKTWDQVGQSLTDAIISGGITARDALVRAFKAAVLTPTIQAIGQNTLGSIGQWGSGGQGVRGQGGGMVNSILGYAAMGTGVGSYFAAGMGATLGGVGLGTTLAASGVATGAAGTVAATAGMGAGIATAIGAVAPWLIALYGIYKIFSSRKGGPKQEGFYGTDLFGPSGGANTTAMYTVARDAGKEATRLYNELGRMLGANTGGVQFGAAVSMDPHGSSRSFVEINATRMGKEIAERINVRVGRTQEEVAEAIQTQMADVVIEALLQSGIDAQVYAYFNKISAGLTGQERLAALEAAAQMGKLRDEFRLLGKVTEGLSNISLDAVAAITEFAGGIDSLRAGLASFYTEKFFSPAELQRLRYEQAAQILNASGAYQPTTADNLANWSREDIREIIEYAMRRAALPGAQGAQAQRELGGLMQVLPLLDANLTYAEDAAERARQEWEEANRAAMDAHNARITQIREERAAQRKQLEDAVADSLDVLTDAYNRQKGELTELRDRMEAASEAIGDFLTSLRLDDNLSTLTPGQRMTTSQEEYQRALMQAQAEGYTGESVSRLTRAAQEMLQNARGYYASGAGYTALFEQVQRELTAAQAQAAKQATQADAQLHKLDQQVGHLVNIQTILLSVDQALRNYLAAQQALINFNKVPEWSLYPKPPTLLPYQGPDTLAPAVPAAEVVYGGGGGGGTIMTGTGGQSLADAFAAFTGGNTPTSTPPATTSPGGWYDPAYDDGGGGAMRFGSYAEGLPRVPYDNFPAILHRGERVMTARENDNLLDEMRALREEVVRLRTENRQDAGSTIAATFDATQQAASIQSEATLRAARLRDYQSKTRPVLA